jgi:hypothetical protein
MPEYTPSDELQAEIAAFDELDRLWKEGRDRLRAAVGRELHTYEAATSKNLAPHLPWSEETVRAIAREHKVPLKRPPTVRSIKPRKRR